MAKTSLADKRRLLATSSLVTIGNSLIDLGEEHLHTRYYIGAIEVAWVNRSVDNFF